MKLEQAPRNGLLSAASRNSDDRNKHPAASALPSTAPPPPPLPCRFSTVKGNGFPPHVLLVSRSVTRVHSLLLAGGTSVPDQWGTVVGRPIVTDYYCVHASPWGWRTTNEIDFSWDARISGIGANLIYRVAIADKSSRTSAGLTREAWDQMCQSFLRKMADGWIDGASVRWRTTPLPTPVS